MVKYAADPCNADACRVVKLVDSADKAAPFYSCLVACMAFVATLGNVAKLHGLMESGLTFFDIVRVFTAGAGAYFLAQASFTYLHGLYLRKYLQKGTVLELDDSIARLDLSKCEDAAAIKFRLQEARNARLRRVAEKASRL